MSNNAANVLGNAVKKNITGKNNTFNVDVQQRAQNVVNYTTDQAQKARESFGKLSRTNKFLLIFGILILILVISFIFKYYRDQNLKEQFMNAPLFLTGIENNKPHNAKKIYSYTDSNTGRTTPYIPGYLFNEKNGTQYTFNFWLYINGKEWNYRFGEWKHIFHRGSPPLMSLEGNNVNNDNITKLNTQVPGFWLSPKENRLNCIITTDAGKEERITLDDIELNKWLQITLVVNTNNVALYRDGKLERMVNLFGKLNSNKDAVYINYFGGFGGNLAFLQFFDKVLSPTEVMKLYNNFSSRIDSYKKYQFDREINTTKILSLLKPDEDINDGRCDYLREKKKGDESEMYINRLKKAYIMLCKNTQGKTEKECNDVTEQYGLLLKGVSISSLKNILTKFVNNIKYISGGYQYNDTNTMTGKETKRISHLSKEQYDEIKKMIS